MLHSLGIICTANSYMWYFVLPAYAQPLLHRHLSLLYAIHDNWDTHVKHKGVHSCTHFVSKVTSLPMLLSGLCEAQVHPFMYAL